MSTTPPELTPSQLTHSQNAYFKELVRHALIDTRVAIPAIVQDFDPNTQTCTVTIAIREVVRTNTGPKNVAISPIQKIPVMLPRAGGFCLTLPLQAGDEGMLIFCDMCFDLWWTRGGIQNQLERRRHDLTDCGFYPGMWSQPRVLPNYAVDSAQLRSDDGLIVVDVAQAGITLAGPKVTIQSSGDVDINATGNINLSPTGDTVINGKIFLLHEHTLVQTGTDFSGPVTP
jgi:hypothetical protein